MPELHDELLAAAVDLETTAAAFQTDPVTGLPVSPVIVEADTLARASRLLRTAGDVLSVAAELPPPGS
jgi:hypothetical protein